MSDIHDLTALEQATAIRDRKLSPAEITEHYLRRVERHDRELGAYITVTADLARDQARVAEQTVADTNDADALPPLHGVPVPIKDLNMVAGVRTTFGSRVYADFVPPVEDTVATLIRGAGAILLGKTNTPEFGLPCYTENAVAPPARTPWDTARSAGGSSGGAAAAVAAGLAPVAQGSDGGGSIRIPSSVCGLVGLKPSRGRVSGGPILADVSGLPVNGPLARTVRDAAALLDVMAVPQPGDPYWLPRPAESFLACADRDPRRLRVGRYRTPVVADVDLHPDCVAAYEQATGLLTEIGHEVVEVDPPFGAGVVPAFETLWSVLAAINPVDPAREEELLPFTRWLRQRGRGPSAVEYAQAVATLQLVSRQAVQAVHGCDAVLTPTLAAPPARVGGIRDDADPARDFAAQMAFTPFTATYNVTGQPAVSLPLYWDADGLPIGVMLSARPGDEATLIALSAQLERAHPWRDRQPEQW
ncbi:MAG: amidase [Streptosporangiaceae bacterium]